MTPATDREAWWSARRRTYNIILVISCVTSAVLVFVVWAVFEDRLPCLEINGFSILAGLVVASIGILAANGCYLLGPLSERFVRPRNPRIFRRVVFGAGVAFSMLLIFFPVAGNLTAAYLRLPCTDEFGKVHNAKEIPPAMQRY